MNLKFPLLGLSVSFLLLVSTEARANAALLPGIQLVSAVQQYNPTSKSFGNFESFPVAGGHSLPAYYDLTGETSTSSGPLTLCPGDAGVLVSAIHDPVHPTRTRVEVTSPGPHVLQVIAGSSCAENQEALLTQPLKGVTTSQTPVAAGDAGSFVLLEDNTVRAWGAGEHGYLGTGVLKEGFLGERSSSAVPTAVVGLNTVVGVSSYLHTMALLSNGTVQAWGWNRLAGLGNDSHEDSPVPIPISGLSDVVSVCAGYGYSLALLADGSVKAWGYNSENQLGTGSSTDLSPPKIVPGLERVAQIACSGSHGLALLPDGTVQVWGEGSRKELGLNESPQHAPLTVSGLTGVVSMSGGNHHNLALKADGTVWSWGENTSGQLGNGQETARGDLAQVLDLKNVIAISSGEVHNLALLADGTVEAWGENGRGQLGNGKMGTPSSSVPVHVSNLTNVVAISAGGLFGLALQADGTLWAWGDNDHRQLGDEIIDTYSLPIKVNMGGLPIKKPTR